MNAPSTAAAQAWRAVADLKAPPHSGREPLHYAAWQAWRTSQGDHGETATRRLMALPQAAQAVYHELVEFFMAGGRLDPMGRPLQTWERAC